MHPELKNRKLYTFLWYVVYIHIYIHIYIEILFLRVAVLKIPGVLILFINSLDHEIHCRSNFKHTAKADDIYIQYGSTLSP